MRLVHISHINPKELDDYKLKGKENFPIQQDTSIKGIFMRDAAELDNAYFGRGKNGMYRYNDTVIYWNDNFKIEDGKVLLNEPVYAYFIDTEKIVVNKNGIQKPLDDFIKVFNDKGNKEYVVTGVDIPVRACTEVREIRDVGFLVDKLNIYCYKGEREDIPDIIKKYNSFHENNDYDGFLKFLKLQEDSFNSLKLINYLLYEEHKKLPEIEQRSTSYEK